jgi:hypothetical protein
MGRVTDLRRELAIGRHVLDKGRVYAVEELVAKQPQRLYALMECLWDEDAGVACRAADVLERLTAGRMPRIDPRRLGRWKGSLLGLIPEAQPKKLRWNLALLVPRLELSVPEAGRAASALRAYLVDSSSIVKTAAMHGLTGLTRHDPSMLPEVLDMLRILSRSGTPAMRARGRILLGKLERKDMKPGQG